MISRPVLRNQTKNILQHRHSRNTLREHNVASITATKYPMDEEDPCKMRSGGEEKNIKYQK